MSEKIIGYCACCGEPRYANIGVNHTDECIYSSETIDIISDTDDVALEQVITDGIQFVKSLTEYYGSTKGQEVWRAMGDAVGKSLQNKIFLAMLTGQSGLNVSFKADKSISLNNAIPVIKCIRMHTGYSLRDAKDAWEESKLKTCIIQMSSGANVAEFRKDLRQLGCLVY